MTRKHCGWEAVIWHPPANARPQLRLTQSPMPQGVSQPTLVPCLSSHANRCLKTKTPHRSTLPLLPNRSRPKYRTGECSTDVSRHMHQKQNYGSGTYLHVFVQLVHVCWSPFKSHTCTSGSHLPFQQSPPQFFQPFSSLPYPLSSRGFSSQNTMTWTRRSQPTFQPVLGSQHGPSHISGPRSPGITEKRVSPATGLWVGIANLHKAP